MWLYGYDHNNRLVEVERKASSSDPVDLRVNFEYDPLGNRTLKSVDADGDGVGAAAVTKFGYDAQGNAWADLTLGGSLITRRFYADAVDALFARMDASSGDENWYLTDRLGSVRDLVDHTGTAFNHLDWGSYGELVTETGTGSDRYGWTSRERDVEIGLQYNRARYYDWETGRWISQDPIGFDAGDGNLYRYVFNQSNNATDPSGLDYCPGWGEAYAAWHYAKDLKAKGYDDNDVEVLIHRARLRISGSLRVWNVKFDGVDHKIKVFGLLNKEYTVVANAYPLAVETMNKVYEVVNDDILWERAKTLYADPNHYSFFVEALKHRDHYKLIVNKIINGLRENPPRFTYDEGGGGKGGSAYVAKKGGAIHLREGFFKGGTIANNARTITHEFGRVYLWDELPKDMERYPGGRPHKERDYIENFDDFVFFINKNYKEIKSIK